MAKRPAWMPCYITDYLRDTTRLTTEGHGAYLLLIFDYWVQGQPLPDDDAQLAAITRLSPQKWKALRPTLAQLFQVGDGVWRHKRIDRELVLATERITKLSEAGKRGAAAKHGIADGDECGDVSGLATSQATSQATDIATSPPSGQATPHLVQKHKSTKKGRHRQSETPLKRAERDLRKPTNPNIKSTSLTEPLTPRPRDAHAGGDEPNPAEKPEKEEKAFNSLIKGVSQRRFAPFVADAPSAVDPAVIAMKKRDNLIAKLFRFVNDSFPLNQQVIAANGLLGLDPNPKHGAQWWLDHLDKLMRSQGWDDTIPSRRETISLVGHDPGPNPNADDYAFRQAASALMAAE